MRINLNGTLNSIYIIENVLAFDNDNFMHQDFFTCYH